MSLRIGHGLDAHRLVPGRRLMLGGVHVDHDLGLAGHSDGDALAHALGDAVLGAAGLGDIGRHFPSAEECWRDLAGVDLLAAVAEKLAAAGASLVSASAVVIAERPRLADHLDAMGAACAAALGAEPGAVRVSATTTDGMGLTGRGEGIAVSAVALVDDGV